MKTILKRKALFLIVIVLSLSLVAVGCSNGTDSSEGSNNGAPNKGETIKIGANNWAENIAAANMWKVLLEEKGYDVKVTTGGKATIWSGVASHDLDLTLEAWLPKADKPSWDRFKDDLNKYGPWYEGAKLGLAVPEYVNMDSIEDLNENKDNFIVNGNPSIVGIDSGANLMTLTEKAIEEYELDYTLISSSGPSMIASLKKATEKDEPIVVTLWNPHWIFAQEDLKYLEDPKNVYGKADDIYFVANEKFDEEYPKVISWMENWKMNDQTLGTLMAEVKDADDPEAAAEKWIDENRDVVDKWFE